MPPPNGVFKVNFEASWSKDQKIVCIGVVIRDFRGEFYAKMSKVGSSVAFAEVAELVAARESMIFAVEARFRDIIEGIIWVLLMQFGLARIA